MTLKAAIQFPIARIDSFDIVLGAYAKLARAYVSGHKSMKHPFSFKLVPEGDHFLGEIWVPLNGRQEIESALEILVGLDMVYRRAHSFEPTLYKSGTRYGAANKIAWFTTPILLDKKKGDCKDLSADRVASLRLAGETDAKCHLKLVKPLQWHVQVQRGRKGGGAIEDPSDKLGMRTYFEERREAIHR